MMKYIYRYWVVVPVLLLAILSRDWVEDPVEQETEVTIDMTQSEADYYLEGFETRKLDMHGKTEYVITGKTLSHYPEDDSSVIENPHLVLFREGSMWDMRSAKGVLNQNPETFFLEGEVSMLRTIGQLGESQNETENAANSSSSAGSTTTRLPESIQLNTSDVTVRTEQNTVETQKPITVVAENWQLSSIGLSTNTLDGTLILKSQVKGRYEIAE